ncbi:hypothetical protein THMIRHAS_20910 [Thiosulfatimonas sediminis]|uniref:Uncharacterized protein n=1 Tax=Thiosulfatimonas sediminis TaxID=2675054 RepID=A0A6F8PXK0_9GAMM|nr:hypothetical protein [Thiosulfatimonas sediminis]BBP46718.1 hypothetical protein THMIRHAS_20910 [Thiosulfatimonas sediminis]
MRVNKMLKAYRTLFNYAKEKAYIAEYQTWQHLGHTIEKAEQVEHDLAELSAKEFAQVQRDLHTDMMQLAEYLADVQQGVKEFLDMDLPVLEKLLIDKAMSLADPTEITVLRMRIAAAMDDEHPMFDKPH